MSVGDLQAIGPPPAQPPKYGLLVATDTVQGDAEIAASGIEQSSPREWAQGVEWAPEAFHGGGAAGVDCFGSTPDGLDFTANPVANTAEPFVVYASDECGLFGFEGRDPFGRAVRQLLATQSYSIAKEFQLGTIRDAQGLQNVALEDAIQLASPATPSPTEALGALEGAISERFKGARAMIHCTVNMLTHLMHEVVIVQAGQKWLTALGSIVVADAGYEALGGTVEVMYATGIVRVRLGAVITLPDSAAMRGQGIDRATNLQQVIAERLVLIQVDANEAGSPGNPDAMFKTDVDVPTSWSVT